MLFSSNQEQDYIDLYMCVFPNYTASSTECFSALAVEYFPVLSSSVFQPVRNKTTSTSICASLLTILVVLLNIFPPLRAVKSFPAIATEYLPELASGCMHFDLLPLIKCSRVLLDLPLYFPALNIRLEPKCVPQFMFLGSLLGTRLSAIGQFFSQSLATVPEVFAEVNSTQFPF